MQQTFQEVLSGLLDSFRRGQMKKDDFEKNIHHIIYQNINHQIETTIGKTVMSEREVFVKRVYGDLFIKFRSANPNLSTINRDDLEEDPEGDIFIREGKLSPVSSLITTKTNFFGKKTVNDSAVKGVKRFSAIIFKWAKRMAYKEANDLYDHYAKCRAEEAKKQRKLNEEAQRIIKEKAEKEKPPVEKMRVIGKKPSVKRTPKKPAAKK